MQSHKSSNSRSTKKTPHNNTMENKDKGKILGETREKGILSKEQH